MRYWLILFIFFFFFCTVENFSVLPHSYMVCLLTDFKNRLYWTFKNFLSLTKFLLFWFWSCFLIYSLLFFLYIWIIFFTKDKTFARKKISYCWYWMAFVLDIKQFGFSSQITKFLFCLTQDVFISVFTFLLLQKLYDLNVLSVLRELGKALYTGCVLACKQISVYTNCTSYFFFFTRFCY